MIVERTTLVPKLRYLSAFKRDGVEGSRPREQKKEESERSIT